MHVRNGLMGKGSLVMDREVILISSHLSFWPTFLNGGYVGEYYRGC